MSDLYVLVEYRGLYEKLTAFCKEKWDCEFKQIGMKPGTDIKVVYMKVKSEDFEDLKFFASMEIDEESGSRFEKIEEMKQEDYDNAIEIETETTNNTNETQDNNQQSSKSNENFPITSTTKKITDTTIVEQKIEEAFKSLLFDEDKNKEKIQGIEKLLNETVLPSKGKADEKDPIAKVLEPRYFKMFSICTFALLLVFGCVMN